MVYVLYESFLNKRHISQIMAEGFANLHVDAIIPTMCRSFSRSQSLGKFCDSIYDNV